jgi:methyl-accepting chemotaxis protein
MFAKWNLTQKVIVSVSAVLLVTSLLSFWVTRERVNRQAEDAFRDKLRQITGMASAAREWYSANLDKLVPNYDFKHLEQVPVVVAWKMAQQYAQGAGMEFKTPSPNPRDSRNSPDQFERRALAQFQQHPDLKEYSEQVTENGRQWMRYAQPVRVSADCLICHGDPVGSKDPFGYTKEGMKAGDLRAAFSVKAPADELVADASSNSRMLLLTSSLTLLAACVAVALVIGRTVIKPLIRVKNLLQRLADGDLTKRLQISTQDEVGQMGAALNLTIDKISEVVREIGEESVNVANASEEFSAVSQQISANSEETSAQANTVSGATDQVNRGLQTVSTATEQMSASIREIAKNSTEAAKVADGAMKTTLETNVVVAKLGESSAEIGQVIKVITSIAQKTDLLALNATVEAARAGDVGAGFAVVANEVKELAKQTATATEDISRKIEAIQQDAKGAVQAIGSITEVIGQVNQISATIATAVEEQSATTSEMSRSLSEAARGASEVAQNIQGVAQAAQSTSNGAADSQKAARSLAEMSTHLRSLVGRFNVDTDNRTERSSFREPNKPRSDRVPRTDTVEELAIR